MIDIDAWLTRVPEEPDAVMVDDFGNSIFGGDKYYNVNGVILSEESLDDAKRYLEEEGEAFTCACCEETFGDDYSEPYYEINGELFCYRCVVEEYAPEVTRL